MLPEKLGPYILGKVLGRGGMGTVYAAQDEKNGQHVAVKILAPQLAHAEGFRERFEAEIDSLKKLQHPGIVRLYGYGEQDGILFYSMENVVGTSLAQELLAGRRFQWREVVKFAIQISLALKHAHDHGIIHRDIKPANILLDENENTKLADFGIARLFGGTQLTSAGGVLGTADYMPPEQAAGEHVTDKCDQYSLGCLMYILLTGRTPFKAKNLPEMLQLQRYANAEPISRYASNVPNQLNVVVLQLLSKTPSDRFPNTQILARHLEALELALSQKELFDEKLSDQPKQDRLLHAQPGSSDGDQTREFILENTQAKDFTSGTNPLALEVTELKPSKGFGKETATLENSLSQKEKEVPISLDFLQTKNESSTDDKPPTLPPTQPNRFITVEEVDRIEASKSSLNLARALQSSGIALALIAIIGTGLFLLKPDTADNLYHSIQTSIQTSGTSDLRPLSPKIEEFIKYYATDSRIEKIKSYAKQLDLQQIKRRIDRHTFFTLLNSEMLPIEYHYLTAVQISKKSPLESIVRLKALTSLYLKPNSELSERDLLRHKACFQLAQKQLKTL